MTTFPHLIRRLRAGALALGLAALLTTASQAQMFLAVTDGGGLYRVDLNNFTSELLFSSGFSEPNGLAWDNDNGVAYYSSNGNNSLYMWDSLSNTQVAVTNSSGTPLTGSLADASFYDGYYWYIGSGSDDLYRVAVDLSNRAAPTISNITVYADFDGAAGSSYSFGDITITPDGILYGGTTGGELFLVDISGGSPTGFTQVGDNGISLQIAWDETTGQIYGKGHSAATGWWIVDATDASLTPVEDGGSQFALPDNVRDIASFPTVIPEPVAGSMLAAGLLLLLKRRRR